MSIAIITSKPFTARAIAAHACHLWGRDYPIDYPLIMLNGYYRPPLPRGLAWKDYPWIDPIGNLALYEMRAIATPNQAPLMYSEKGLVEDQNAYEQAIRKATAVICVVDPSARETWAADILRKKFCAPSCPFVPIRLFDYSSSSIGQVLQDAFIAIQSSSPPALPDWYLSLSAEGQVRAYVDHQFALNSLAVFGKMLGNQQHSSPWVSKYQVQALFAISKKAQSLSHWMEEFKNWKGTGKYLRSAGAHDFSEPSLGSAASRIAIVRQLMDHGWVSHQTNSSESLSLTPEGKEVVGKLHPGCFDPDLPFRIAQWMGEGLAKSQPAIDRYIRTFFGRQKKFNGSGIVTGK